jgi:prepilin-type processing-associated H-X9-DG protein
MIDANCTGSGSGTAASPWVADTERCANTGIFFGNSSIAIKQIADGTSKTFMIGERDKFCLAATWIGVRNPYGPDSWSSNWAMAHVWYKLNYPLTGAHDTCTETFSSAHPGGAFFAFCDGSVTFIKDDIESDPLDINTPGGVNNKNCYASPNTTAGTPCKTQAPGPKYIGIYQKLAWRNDQMVIDGGDY